MRSFLARLSGSPRARIRIRPDCDYVFLSGYGEAARGQYLRGKLTLVMCKGERIKGVRLKMTGRLFIGDHKAVTESSAKWETSDFTLHQWDPFFIQSQPCQPSRHGDIYEWPFELFIGGNQEESFRGCNLCGMTYRLEASTINDASHSSFQTFLPIRVIRCPPESSYELMDPKTTQGEWSGKVKYNVSLGHQAIALGGLVPVNVQISMLEAGTEFIKARFILHEHHQICDKDQVSFGRQRIVSEWPLIIDDGTQQMHTWQQCLQLSKMAGKCSHDFTVCGVTVDHTLHFAVTLLDNNGIETEFETSMPITLFVSPELPVNGWGSFVQQNEKSIKESLDILSGGIQIPPKYCSLEDDVSNYEGPSGTPPPVYSEN